MKLTLVEDWKAILSKAWSVKFMIIGGICEVLAQALPADERGVWGWIAVANLAMGVGARVLAQKEISK